MQLAEQEWEGEEGAGDGEGIAGGLFTRILPLVKAEPALHPLALDFSMGFLSPRVLNELFAGLQPYLQELSKVKKLGGKKDPLRLHIANIVRGCAFSLSVLMEMEDKKETEKENKKKENKKNHGGTKAESGIRRRGLGGGEVGVVERCSKSDL